MKGQSGQGRRDTASRVIDAPADEIHRAFVDSELLMRWLPPKGMSGIAHEYDFRKGGRYRIELRYEDSELGGSGKSTDRSDVSKGRFVELLPGRCIKQSVEFESNDPAFAGEMTMTWSFDAAPSGTRVTITADNVPRGIKKADHEVGLKSSIDNLALFVNENASKS